MCEGMIDTATPRVSAQPTQALPPSTDGKAAPSRALAAFKENWPVWLVAGSTLANGLMSIEQTLFTRFREYPQFLAWALPFGLHHWGRSLALIFGFMLVYLSINLFEHKRVAWWLATVVSALLVLAYVIRGHLWYSAAAPAATLALLLIFRGRFSVRSEPTSIVRGILLMVVSLLVALAYGTLGFWLLDKQDFGLSFNLADSFTRTIRQFTMLGNSDLVAQTRHARWFLESLSILGIVSFCFAAYSLFRPVVYRLRVLPEERAKAKAILEQYGRSPYDYFKVWPDKSYFFLESRRSFISYRTVLGVAFCLGDPVGPDEDLEKVTGSFLRFCSDNGWLVCFLMPDLVPMYQRLGLSVLKIGQDAVVDLERFVSHTAGVKYFRYIRRKFEGEGYKLVRYTPPHPRALLDEVEEVSKEWLTLPRHREFAFVQGRFERSYIGETSLTIVRDSAGRPMAFVNEVPSYRVGEATFDMMRHRPGVHWGTMDYLFQGLMLILKQEGYCSFNLGLAPFAGVGEKPGATIGEKAIHQLYEHLNWLVSAKGLRQYKVKFEPTWEDRFVVYQGGPLGLMKIAIAISQVL
jgi:phosphatidylglycerol lysyltransferase